jgi:hypothetical protein
MGPLLGAVKVLLFAQAMHGTVLGRVWDAETAQPVPGAVVAVPEFNRTIAADDSGRYAIQGLKPGSHSITVRSIGYAPRTLEALVPESGPLEIDFWLVAEPVRIHAVDVRAPVIVRGLDADAAAAFPDREISYAALRDHPLLGEPDALQALGGGEISLRQESPSGVNVRGGASDQTAYLIDGIPVFNPYHAAGMASGWNPDALSRLRAGSVTTDAYSEALAGAVEATTRSPGDRIRARGSVSTTQSRITFDGPLAAAGPGPTEGAAAAGYLVSLRRGLPDGIAPKGEYSYVRGETNDWLAKLEAPTLGGRIELLGYGNENDLSTAMTVVPDGDVPDPRRNTFEWTGQSLGARWSRTLGGATLRVQGWRADGNIGSAWAAETGRLTMASTREDAGFLVGMDQSSERAGTTAQLRIERSRTSYRIVSDSTSGPTWAAEASLPVATGSARHRHAVGRALEIQIGGSVATARDRWHLDPQAQVLWKPSSRIELSGSYARTHQFAQSLRNPESVVGNIFPADLYLGAGATAATSGGSPSGATGVPVARSQLSVLALSFQPRTGLRLGAQAYGRRSDGLLLVAPIEGEPFATRGLFAIGSGASWGVSADAALSARRCGIVASYGLQQARVEYGSTGYTPESGVRQTFEGGVIVLPTPTASIRISVAAALGRRATAISDGFEWEATNILDRGSEFGGSPHYTGGALGGTSLPGYYRLDAGIRKEWRLGVAGRNATLALFGTATNILGRKNVLTYARDPSTGEISGVEMRPRAPLVVGLDWGF